MDTSQGPQPISDKPAANARAKLNLTLIIVGALLLTSIGIGGFFLGKQTTSEKVKTEKQMPIAQSKKDKGFVERIDKVYSFKNSKGNTKKIVILNKTSDINSIGNEVYLTDSSLDFSKSTKIWESGYYNRFNIHFPNQEKKSKFVIEIQPGGDSTQALALFTDEGKIVNGNLLDFDLGEIAYRQQRKTYPNAGGSIGMHVVGFNPNNISDTDSFVVEINDALGNIFPVDIDLTTGKHTERAILTAGPTPSKL